MLIEKPIWADLAEPPVSHALHGEWFVIRVSPDLATGEMLNIGVCVRIGGKTHTKILPNATPFFKLYGKSGRENMLFLFDLLRKQEDWTRPVSPQVSMSRPMPVSGNSIDEILDRLYRDMVILDMLKDQSPNRDYGISTEKLRSKIFSYLKKENEDFANAVWRGGNNPVHIKTSIGNKVLEHIQLWIPSDMARKQMRFASFVSVDYQRPIFPELHLLQAGQDIEVAHKAFKNTPRKAALFIYRPDNLTEFDNQIDITTWLLRKNLGSDKIDVEVESNTENLRKMALAFAA